MKFATRDTVSKKFTEHLIRGICHDMGAPARHLVQFSQMLNEHYQSNQNLEEKHHQWLDLIASSGKKLQEMIISLSEISKLSRCNEETPIDLALLLKKTLAFNINERQIPDTHIDITISGTWPNIIAVEYQWHMLLTCLIENALLFHPLKQESHQIKLLLHCEVNNHELSFSIEDNGIGLTEHQITEITKPFKRLNRQHEYSGIGMGLTYCQYIAEINHANLTFSTATLGGLRVTYNQLFTEVQQGKMDF